jgi:hypothetical protein
VEEPASAIMGIPGSENLDVMAAAEELLGQRLHVSVDAPLVGP